MVEQFNKQLYGSIEHSLSELVDKVRKETGFDENCAIKYICKYMNVTYDIERRDEKYFFVLNANLKSVEEILNDNTDMGLECLEQIQNGGLNS